VLDVIGKTLHENITSENSCDLDLSFLLAGTYFLKINIEGKNLVHKMVLGKLRRGSIFSGRASTTKR
jgi:hypothetical protein